MTDTETHPSPGMRSHWPVIPEIRLLWTIMTPLGLPVEPLVYITTARSEGWGFTIALPTARQTINYNIVLYLQYLSTMNSTKEHNQGESEIRTILRQLSQLLYSLHAVDGQSCWVAICAHFLLVHIDHMLQFWKLLQHILGGKRRKLISQQGQGEVLVKAMPGHRAWSWRLPHHHFKIRLFIPPSSCQQQQQYAV